MRKNIIALAFSSLLYLQPAFSFAQQVRLVLDGAYINIKGGTHSNSVFLVVDGSNTTGITRLGAGGHIYTEGQYNFVKWNAGTGTGNYVFPFGVAGNPADYIPCTFNKTTSGSSDIIASTWSTSPQNVPHPGVSYVSACYVMKGDGDSLTTALDRFWDIRTTASATADITFSYRGAENTISSPTAALKVQRWNGLSGQTWNTPVGNGNNGVTSGIGTVGPVTGITNFTPFVAVRAAAPMNFIPLAANKSFAMPKKNLDGGFYQTINDILYFQYSEEYLGGILKYTVYDKNRNVVISNNSLAKKLGNNVYALNCLCVIGQGYYILEIVNEKKETVKLRFYYPGNPGNPC